MKHAKSYKYLMQHTAVLLFCADTFDIILLYFKYKMLSKIICFHPLVHPYISDSSTKFPIDLISSLTAASIFLKSETSQLLVLINQMKRRLMQLPVQTS